MCVAPKFNVSMQMPRMPLEFDSTNKKKSIYDFAFKICTLKLLSKNSCIVKLCHDMTWEWIRPLVYKLWFRVMIMDYPWTVEKQYVSSVIFISVAAFQVISGWIQCTLLNNLFSIWVNYSLHSLWWWFPMLNIFECFGWNNLTNVCILKTKLFELNLWIQRDFFFVE